MAASSVWRFAEIVTVAVDCTPLIGPPAGVATFVRGFATALATRHDIRARGFALSWRGRRALAAVVPHGVDVVGRPMPAGALLRTWSLVNGPPGEWWTGAVDVLHGTNFVVPPSRRAARVVTVHDLTAVRYPELCTATTLQYPALIERAVRTGSFVHTPSEFVAAEVVERFGASPDRVRAIAHGLDTAIGDSNPDAPDDAGPPFLLAVGTVEPRKDYPRLVRAFDVVAGRHADLRLVIAGSDGWGTQALDAAIAASAHAARIERRRAVTDVDRKVLMRHAAVLVFPSVYEGFGLPPLEAMADGTPVVATAVGAVPEVVGDAALLVPPGDDDALVAAIESVVDDEAMRSQLVAAGRRRVRRFDWAQTAAAMVALYRDAMAAR